MLEKELNIFGKEVIKRAKKNLTKNKIKDSNLSKSLKFSVKNNVLTFSMNDYGEFIDAGVKGVGGTKADGTKWDTKKVTNRKFKYTNKKPPFMAFNGWSIKKGIAPRNKKGQFTSRKSILFAIANSVYHTGLKTTDFFQDAFYDEVDNMTDRLSNSLALKIELALVDSIENNKKIKII
tara:strand:- start:245 stop:778 length:534 start_codon:yes stop_codon:yes gene_type:complete